MQLEPEAHIGITDGHQGGEGLNHLGLRDELVSGNGEQVDDLS